MTTTSISKYLTPEQASALLPYGNADWVRSQLRRGTLRGSKIGGRWMAEAEAIDDMVAAGSNSTTRRRRQRRIA